MYSCFCSSIVFQRKSFLRGEVGRRSSKNSWCDGKRQSSFRIMGLSSSDDHQIFLQHVGGQTSTIFRTYSYFSWTAELSLKFLGHWSSPPSYFLSSNTRHWDNVNLDCYPWVELVGVDDRNFHSAQTVSALRKLRIHRPSGPTNVDWFVRNFCAIMERKAILFYFEKFKKSFVLFLQSVESTMSLATPSHSLDAVSRGSTYPVDPFVNFGSQFTELLPKKKLIRGLTWSVIPCSDGAKKNAVLITWWTLFVYS